MRTLVALLAVSLIAAVPVWSQTADTVLVNGRILTVDERFSTQQALAISDGKIIAVGSTANVRKLAGPKSLVIDLQGRSVFPSFPRRGTPYPASFPPQTLRAVSTTSSSFRHWSSVESRLPAATEAKPHCGLSARFSSGTYRAASSMRRRNSS